MKMKWKKKKYKLEHFHTAKQQKQKKKEWKAAKSRRKICKKKLKRNNNNKKKRTLYSHKFLSVWKSLFFCFYYSLLLLLSLLLCMPPTFLFLTRGTNFVPSLLVPLCTNFNKWVYICVCVCAWICTECKRLFAYSFMLKSSNSEVAKVGCVRLLLLFQQNLCKFFFFVSNQNENK